MTSTAAISLLYRGPLASCNYACGYCPFAKRNDNREQLARDRAALERFVDRVVELTRAGERFRVLFTPWGEALVRRTYRDAMTRLSWQDGVESVGVQTNLSAGLRWLSRCRCERLRFWATYHPTETTLVAFLRQVDRVRRQGAAVSVGLVAVPGETVLAEEIRQQVPDDIYVWLNPQQPRRRSFTKDEIAALGAVDPLFPVALQRHASQGRACRAGRTSLTVDGRGDLRRCHFVDTVLGNLYQPDWRDSLAIRACPNRFCDCYLGFSQLEHLRFESMFGADVLERIPPSRPTSLPDHLRRWVHNHTS